MIWGDIHDHSIKFISSFFPEKEKNASYVCQFDATKCAKYDSAVNNISIDRRSHFGKPLDEEFLRDFQILDKKQKKPVTTVVKSVLNTELTCFPGFHRSWPLPNEILFKIFGYLNIQEVRLSAQVSHQFNIISKDSSLKPELLIEQKRSP